MNVRAISLLLGAMVCGGHLAGCCHEAEIPAAIKGLYGAETRERNKSLQVLAQCGSRVDIYTSVPRIAALLYDTNVGVASSAAYALRRIDTKEAREALKLAEEARARRSQGVAPAAR